MKISYKKYRQSDLETRPTKRIEVDPSVKPSLNLNCYVNTSSRHANIYRKAQNIGKSMMLMQKDAPRYLIDVNDIIYKQKQTLDKPVL